MATIGSDKIESETPTLFSVNWSFPVDCKRIIGDISEYNWSSRCCSSVENFSVVFPGILVLSPVSAGVSHEIVTRSLPIWLIVSLPTGPGSIMAFRARVALESFAVDSLVALLTVTSLTTTC